MNAIDSILIITKTTMDLHEKVKAIYVHRYKHWNQSLVYSMCFTCAA